MRGGPGGRTRSYGAVHRPRNVDHMVVNLGHMVRRLSEQRVDWDRDETRKSVGGIGKKAISSGELGPLNDASHDDDYTIQYCTLTI